MTTSTTGAVTVEVPVVAVPRVVGLTDGDVYLFRDGRLWSCGSLDCILGHLDHDLRFAPSSIKDHFNGEWAGHGSSNHAWVTPTGDEVAS